MQVQLGNSVTFLPTPLRNWWGKPAVLTAWLLFAIALLAVQVGHIFLTLTLTFTVTLTLTLMSISTPAQLW